MDRKLVSLSQVLRILSKSQSQSLGRKDSQQERWQAIKHTNPFLECVSLSRGQTMEHCSWGSTAWWLDINICLGRYIKGCIEANVSLKVFIKEQNDKLLIYSTELSTSTIHVWSTFSGGEKGAGLSVTDNIFVSFFGGRQHLSCWWRREATSTSGDILPRTRKAEVTPLSMLSVAVSVINDLRSTSRASG